MSRLFSAVVSGDCRTLWDGVSFSPETRQVRQPRVGRSATVCRWSAPGSTSDLTSTRTFRICSIGGGPGFDHTSAVLVATHNNILSSPSSLSSSSSPLHIETTVWDYEQGWSNMVQAMNVATTETVKGLIEESSSTTTAVDSSLSSSSDDGNGLSFSSTAVKSDTGLISN